MLLARVTASWNECFVIVIEPGGFYECNEMNVFFNRLDIESRKLQTYYYFGEEAEIQ